MAEQGTPCGAQEDLWKKGGALQQDYRAEVCACREKTGKAKAPLQLELASADSHEKAFLGMSRAKGALKKTLELAEDCHLTNRD